MRWKRIRVFWYYRLTIANFFDLRYVPDETEFEHEPAEVAKDAPASYEPSDFVTQALQHSNVKLTWDTEDPERTKVTRRKFTKEDLANMDFKAYLASDSEDNLSDQDEETKAKYLALLADSVEDDEKNQEMEITFTPGYICV
jgi:hypothetical protein